MFWDILVSKVQLIIDNFNELDFYLLWQFIEGVAMKIVLNRWPFSSFIFSYCRGYQIVFGYICWFIKIIKNILIVCRRDYWNIGIGFILCWYAVGLFEAALYFSSSDVTIVTSFFVLLRSQNVALFHLILHHRHLNPQNYREFKSYPTSSSLLIIKCVGLSIMRRRDVYSGCFLREDKTDDTRPSVFCKSLPCQIRCSRKSPTMFEIKVILFVNNQVRTIRSE